MRLPLRNAVDVRTSARVIMPCFDSFSSASYRPEGALTPRALIIAPTRELAVQTHKDAELLGKYTGLRVALIYGGAGYETQRKQLEEGGDIVIGTPGRLIDYH